MKDIEFRWEGPPLAKQFSLAHVTDPIDFAEARFSSRFCVLSVDPGAVTGYALMYASSLHTNRILIGDGTPFWLFHLRSTMKPSKIVIEEPPRNAPRVFEREPFYVTGYLNYLRDYPHERILQSPGAMKPAKTWIRLRPGQGVSQHAKDALYHLVYWMIVSSQKDPENKKTPEPDVGSRV